MSQVNLKDVELTELKQHNQNLEETISKKEQEKKEVEEKYQELTNRNTKLTKQVVGQMALQGAKHKIWDNIILEANKFRSYLDYIANQEDALKVAKHKLLIVKQELNMKPMELAQNAINFLSTLLEDQVKRFDIQDIFVVISWDRKVIGKYRMLDTVQDKVEL